MASLLHLKQNRWRLAIGVVLLGIIVAPWLLNLETYSTPADAPGSGDGRYLELPIGRTHYIERGRGPTVVLIGGLTGNHAIWDDSINSFGESFRALAMDTLGHGYSARSVTYAYDREMYREQLRQFLAAKAPDGAALVGTSMGGAIALDFAATYPDRVSSLVLVDTAGFPFDTPAARALVDVPGLGEYLISVLMPVILRQGFARGFADPNRADPQFRTRYRRSAEIVGFKRAVLESLRQMPLHNLEVELQTVRHSGIPTLVVWGKQDRIVPFAVYADIQRQFPEADYIAIHDAGHMPHAERPEIFAPNVRGFLANQFQAPTTTDRSHSASIVLDASDD